MAWLGVGRLLDLSERPCKLWLGGDSRVNQTFGSIAIGRPAADLVDEAVDHFELPAVDGEDGPR